MHTNAELPLPPYQCFDRKTEKCLLSLYYFWSEGALVGPRKERFQVGLPEETSEEISQTIDFLLDYLQDRGYLRHDEFFTEWIPPLLTLHLRSRQVRTCDLSWQNRGTNNQDSYPRPNPFTEAFVKAVS